MFKMSKRIQTQKHAYNEFEWNLGRNGKRKKIRQNLTKFDKMLKKGLNRNCNKLQRNP